MKQFKDKFLMIKLRSVQELQECYAYVYYVPYSTSNDIAVIARGKSAILNLLYVPMINMCVYEELEEEYETY